MELIDRVARLERVVSGVLRAFIHSGSSRTFWGGGRPDEGDWLNTLKSWDGQIIVTEEELKEMRGETNDNK